MILYNYLFPCSVSSACVDKSGGPPGNRGLSPSRWTQKKGKNTWVYGYVRTVVPPCFPVLSSFFLYNKEMKWLSSYHIHALFFTSSIFFLLLPFSPEYLPSKPYGFAQSTRKGFFSSMTVDYRSVSTHSSTSCSPSQEKKRRKFMELFFFPSCFVIGWAEHGQKKIFLDRKELARINVLQHHLKIGRQSLGFTISWYCHMYDLHLAILIFGYVILFLKTCCMVGTKKIFYA